MCFLLENCVKIGGRETELRGDDLQGENEDKTTDNKHNVNSVNKRRRRINRMKTAIIAIVIAFMILPTIGCILLGLQVSKLHKQVNALSLKSTSSDFSEDTALYGENYAFAAVRPVTKSPEVGNQTYSSQTGDTNLINNVASYILSPETKDTDQNMDSRKESNPNVIINEKETNKEIETNKEKEITISNAGIYNGKKVYLTFDDGPSIYTEDVLDILAKYHVKATFFVVGKTDKYSKEMYQRIIKEGHTLGMHSYSHVYKNIYNSVEDFDKDFTKLWKLLYDTTGYKPTIYRFPGGSANLVNTSGMEDFIRYMNANSFVYFDWNVLNGDATGVEYTKEQLINNVLDGVAIKNTSIVLMHDSETKGTTRDSLPELLEALISGGAQMLPLDKDVKPIQQIKFDSIK